MIQIDVLVSSPIFLAGLVQTLTEAGINVVAVRTSLEQEPSSLADAVLIDVDSLSPPGDLMHITETAKCTAVLVLNNETATDVATYLRAGAAGVIGKSDSAEQLISTVRAVTAGAIVAPGDPPAVSASVRAGSPAQYLSEREQQVLHQISRGLTHSQIATRLGISPHTVDTYVKRIRAKLGVSNKAELIHAALLDQQAPPTAVHRGTSLGRPDA